MDLKQISSEVSERRATSKVRDFGVESLRQLRDAPKDSNSTKVRRNGRQRHNATKRAVQSNMTDQREEKDDYCFDRKKLWRGSLEVGSVKFNAWKGNKQDMG